MFFFVPAQGIKTVHAGGGLKKWQNSVHVVDRVTPKYNMRLKMNDLTYQDFFITISMLH